MADSLPHSGLSFEGDETKDGRRDPHLAFAFHRTALTSALPPDAIVAAKASSTSRSHNARFATVTAALAAHLAVWEEAKTPTMPGTRCVHEVENIQDQDAGPLVSSFGTASPTRTMKRALDVLLQTRPGVWIDGKV